MTKEQIRQNWQAVIHQYETSGIKNQSEWCRKNGISLRNFNRWYNRLKNIQSPTPVVQSWMPVQITEKSQGSSLNLRIGKITIEVKDGFQSSLLVQVVKALEEVC